jgi:hypothetical protein
MAGAHGGFRRSGDPQPQARCRKLICGGVMSPGRIIHPDDKAETSESPVVSLWFKFL